MQTDQEKIIKDTYELEKENNTMLKKLRRGQKAGNIFTAIYWIFIIGSFVGAYYFLEPYIQKITGFYTKGANTLDSLNNSKNQIEQFFKPKQTETTPQQ